MLTALVAEFRALRVPVRASGARAKMLTALVTELRAFWVPVHAFQTYNGLL